jgi:hypothetical protein
MTDEEILETLKRVVRAQHDNLLATLHESAERDEAGGNMRAARFYREEIAKIEALPRP